MSVSALSGGQMEDQYMAAVKKHTEGDKGKRGCDAIQDLLARLVMIMEETRQDVLGDLFQGAVSHGENQQYLTPGPIAAFMAKFALHAAREIGEDRPAVWDPSCGSGRLLLAAAEQRRDCVFIGQDIDLACVRMTCLNLALRNLYGYVLWGDTLNDEQKLAYQTGFNGRGFIAEIPAEDCPYQIPETAPSLLTSDTKVPAEPEAPHDPVSVSPRRQGMLF
jgi:type I restriction-modification system DNA methylase subunit